MENKPRKFKNLSLETLVRRYLIGYWEEPIDLEPDEYYQELFDEIKARIEEGGDKNEY